MTTLGISLIICGLTLVCGSMIFLLFTRREPSQESFEEDLGRIEHHLDEAQHAAVSYSLSHQREEFFVVRGPEEVSEIRVDDPL